MIDLEFDEQQVLLQESARTFFASECPLARVRELELSDLGYSPELWQKMAALDWAGLSLPKAQGGAGGSLLDLYVLYLELGRALVPSPHLGSSVIAGETLARAGSAEQQRRLAQIASGDLIVSPALMEAEGDYGPDAVQLTAAPTSAGGYRLDGTKLLVPFAHVAGQLLVLARTAPDATTLFLVEADEKGVELEGLDNTAGYPLFAVRFDAVEVSADAVVGAEGTGWETLKPALDRASVLQCAEIVGAGEAVLEMAVDYSKEREQFGQAIGKFQAVQYLCSDIAIDLHLSSLLARQAAWRVDEGLPHQVELALANAQASEAAQRMVRQAHEVFAGHGFMLETDLQLYTRRAKYWQYNLGEARDHFEAAVDAL
ncbi:MAG: acyl-CoA dehydrogenase family protein [Myxococcota bacterium]